MTAKLTIAVAIYNLENYLDRCLESLLNQTVKKDVEILLINDGSTDRSEDICKKYIEKGLDARVVNKKNGGLTSVRNLSIEESKGDYLLMIDGDDWLELNTVETIFNNLEDFDLLCFGLKWVYKDKIICDERFKSDAVYTENIVNTIFRNEINTGVCNKVFRTKILKDKDIVVPEIKGAEDYIFVYDYLNICSRIKKITANLYNYYQRENSLSNEKSEEFYLNNLVVLNELIKRTKKTKKETTDFYGYILTNYVYLIRDYLKKDNKVILDDINKQRERIEVYLKIGKILFLNTIPFKMRVRYLKIRGKNSR